MIAFAPRPENDFRKFFETYFHLCRERVPQIQVVAAKWRFEDLIPGLSDFDTRFIVRDGMTVEDWHAMSLAVGEIHAELALKRPSWARNLEHLPGLNLMVSEIIDPAQFYPEFQQWTFYDGDRATIDLMQKELSRIGWSARDEAYHLKRIATFFGPYMRGIDPAINLGIWESKYPLHSRFMHYFTPPVQAMASIALGRNVCGKLESLRLAREMFPNAQVINLIFEALNKHYEIPDLYPDLGELEKQLENYLSEAWATITGKVTLIEAEPDDTRKSIAEKIQKMPSDPIEEFFSRVKFVRLMKGRLLFYAREIPCFDSIWLIQNELGRMVDNFYHKPLASYALARYGVKMNSEEILDLLQGEILEPEEVKGIKTFARIASEPLHPGREKQQARTIALTYDPVLATLEKLRTEVLTLSSFAASNASVFTQPVKPA